MYTQLLPAFDQGPEVIETVLSMYRAARDLLVQHSVLKEAD